MNLFTNSVSFDHFQSCSLFQISIKFFVPKKTWFHVNIANFLIFGPVWDPLNLEKKFYQSTISVNGNYIVSQKTANSIDTLVENVSGGWCHKDDGLIESVGEIDTCSEGAFRNFELDLGTCSDQGQWPFKF